jgi:predicted dehydrogenase
VRILLSPANMSAVAEVGRRSTDVTMGEKTSRAKVSVALVGVGSTWELHYRDAIQRLSSKLTVKAICDSVQMRAAVVADEFEAMPISCPWHLTQRTDLHAWLILDPGWFDTYPAALAVQHGRPALYANTFCAPITKLLPLMLEAVECGEPLMPEFPQRFTPSTTRLRELIATKFGPVHKIEVTVPLSEVTAADVTDWLTQNQPGAIGLFDWCACLVGTPCTAVSFQTMSTGSKLRLSFAARSSHPNDPPTATIHFAPHAIDCRKVECERGSASLGGKTQISWQAGEECGQELHGNERSPYEIILDQFCRRALGGLVPVPTVTDAIQAITTMQMALAAVAAPRV